MYFVVRVLKNHPQHFRVCAVTHTRKLLQRFLSFDGQATQFSHHQVYHVVCVSFGVNSAQFPGPLRCIVIKHEQGLVSECRNELNGEECVATSLLKSQLRQGSYTPRLAVKRICQELPQITDRKRSEYDVLQFRSRLTDCVQFPH